MFGFLKKKLKKSVDTLVEKAENEAVEKSVEDVKKEHVKDESEDDKPKEKRGLFKKIKQKEFSENEIDDFFATVEIELMQANLALEVVDYLKNGLKSELVGKPVSRSDAKNVVKNTFKKLLLEIVTQEGRTIKEVIADCKKNGKPATILFLGYNGSGKTTTIAKVSNILIKDGIKPVFAAADTFRAASIEQLQVHADKLGVNVIKHNYGADPAAVLFDARKHAESKKLDVVMADSAGRMHTNVNLMDELKKIVRVNNPDMKILVVDSLTGNDVVSQVKTYSEEVGIDGIILTKMDVNEKGGSILSSCYIAKKPVLYIGTGQEYNCIEEFKPVEFIKKLLGD